MKKIFLVMVLLTALVWACNQSQQNNDTIKDEAPPPGFINQFCDSSGGNSLCPYLPLEAHQGTFVGYDSNLDSVHQAPFDLFSWQSFVALNWPADNNGNPIGATINSYPSNPRVWEYYQDPATVFNKPGQEELLLHLGEAAKNGEKFFYKSSKSAGKLNLMKGFEEADGHPLIDRNLNFALYEIRMSPAEVRFVTTNKLTTVDSIIAYGGRNGGHVTLPASDSASKKVGTTEIKAAWRILDPSKGDDTTRFYTRNALIYVDAAHSRSGHSFFFRAKVGLVGIHIFRITTRFPNGIWSTFEHADNTPDSPQMAQDVRNTRWSFYNPQCLNCALNDTPALLNGENKYKWDTVAPYALSYAVSAPSQPANGKFGTQVVRQFPIFSMTDYINRIWRSKLSGTVWSNYKLIGSQWSNAESFPPPNAPALLANCTLETYIQGSASCITCHNFAAVSKVITPGDTVTVKTDLSFLFPVYAH